MTKRIFKKMARTLPYMPFPISNASMFFDAGVLLHCLCGDSGGRLRGVVLLNVGCGRTERSPCLAGGKTQANHKANQHQKSANKLSHLSSRIWLVIL